jgi:hypothetical protein
MYFRHKIKLKKIISELLAEKVKHYAGMLFPLLKFIKRLQSSATLRYVINVKYSLISRKT